MVHQHSYESLGRHYVLIFYGEGSVGQHIKAAIQPNLQQIAQDVATRLPIAELHHVIVLGIEFITAAIDTFMDIDLWIRPVSAMTQKERQLTKQLQRLKQKQTSQSASQVRESNQTADSTHNPNLEFKQKKQKNELPRIHLNLSIPARSNTS